MHKYNIILILHLSWLFIDSRNLASISFTLGTTRQQWNFAKFISNAADPPTDEYYEPFYCLTYAV
jgi:hypothetical protein